MPPDADFPPPSLTHGSPSWPGSSPKHGRLQYWVDIANGPGFDVEVLDPAGDNERQRKPIHASLSHGDSRSSTAQFPGKSHPSTFPSFCEGVDNAGLCSGSSRCDTSTNEGPALARSPSDSMIDIGNRLDPLKHRRIWSRTGRIQLAEDGYHRYFGATSNLHLIHNGPYSSFTPHLKDIRAEGDLAVKNAGIEWVSDPAFEEHLRECYFTWVNPLTCLIDRDLFDQARIGSHFSEPVLHSPALENAIYSAGIRHTSRQYSLISGDKCEFFANRAKVYLNLELQSPTVATLQALFLLCEHEAAQGRDSQGWIYSGIATRLLPELGLSSESCYLDQMEPCSDAISNVKSRVFWAVIWLDTIWSCWCGRPQAWVVDHIFDRVPVTQANIDVNSGSSEVHTQLIYLVIKFSSIMRTIYHDTQVSRANLANFVLQMDVQLQDWLSSLPPSLRLDSPEDEQSQDPSTFELHLLYHEVQILLHRPFSGVNYIAPAPSGLSPSSQLEVLPATQPTKPRRSHDVCTASSAEIIRLLDLFRGLFGLFHLSAYSVHTLMTAGLMAAYNTSLPSSVKGFEKDASSLTLRSIRILNELSGTLPSARRSVEIITSLRREWQDQQIRVQKRKIGPETGDVDYPSERQRLW